MNIRLIKDAALFARLILLRLLTTIEVAGSSDNRSSRSAIPYSDTSNRLLYANTVKKIKDPIIFGSLNIWLCIVILLSFEINNKFKCNTGTCMIYFLFLSSRLML